MSVALNSVNRRLAVIVGAAAVEASRKPRSNKDARQPTGFSAMEGEKLNATRLKNWAKLSRAEQIEYLKAHPNSIFHKAPLHKDENSQAPTNPSGPATGGGGAADADAAAPAPELKTDEQTGLPRRDATAEDQAEMKQGVAELMAEGASAPGSEVREQAAAVIEAQGADLVRQNVSDDVKAEIENFIGPPKAPQNSNSEPQAQPTPTPSPENQADPASGAASPNSNPNPEPAPAAGPEDIVPDDVQEDDSDDFDDRPSRRRRGSGSSGFGKRLAILAGCLAVAALIGGGAFMIEPTLGVLVGRKILEGFQTAHEFAGEIFASVEGGDPDAIDQFVAQIAEFVRKGELDPELLGMIQKQYG